MKTHKVYGTWLLLCASLIASVGVALDAQWLRLATPGLPRLHDGKPNLAAPAPRTADGKPDLSGLWRNDGGDRYYNNIAVDLKTTDVAPWAHELFLKRQREFGKDSMETRCLPLGPAYLTSPGPWARVVQTPTLIMVAYHNGMHRAIFMDGRSLEADPNPTWMGYSVGRWEGDVLVVESNGYNDRSWLDFGGHPHTEELRITERYLRRNVGRIDVEVTMTDPSVYARPITFSMPMALQADTELLEAVCENDRTMRERIATSKPVELVKVPVATLSEYVGTYDLEWNGRRFVVGITLEDGELWFDDGKGRQLLIALSPTHFSLAGTSVDFSRAVDGTVRMSVQAVENERRGQRRK